MPHQPPLAYGATYQIYTRGNNRGVLFPEPRNYPYFLELYARYITPIAETNAYCLLKGHIHFLVRIKTLAELARDPAAPFKAKMPSRAFNHLFIAYAKAVNKAMNRTGALFESPFKRIQVEEDRYFAALLVYIHRNPQKHGLVEDFRDWPYSSFEPLSTGELWDSEDLMTRWFGDETGFFEAHFSHHDPQFLPSWDLED